MVAVWSSANRSPASLLLKTANRCHLIITCFLYLKTRYVRHYIFKNYKNEAIFLQIFFLSRFYFTNTKQRFTIYVSKKKTDLSTLTYDKLFQYIMNTFAVVLLGAQCYRIDENRVLRCIDVLNQELCTI